MDDKGRLKLPAEIERYLRATGNEFFVTSFDGRTARVYPISEWDKAEALLESPSEYAAMGETLLTRANAWGTDSGIDGQGRILVSPRLRRQMGVENQPVLLTCTKGHVAVQSEAVHEEKMAMEADATAMLAPFTVLGLR